MMRVPRRMVALCALALPLCPAMATELQFPPLPFQETNESGAVPTPPPTEPVAAPMPDFTLDEAATFLISPERFHSDPEVLWPGFLSGLRGFEGFYEPVGNPLYFESPFNNTELRFLYINHAFPDGSQLGGGDVNVYALQIRLALTERLGFIATKDGYSDLNAGILPPDEGWNDLAVGLKYVLWYDREEDFVLTTGMRWELSNGDQSVLQGDSSELSPFISFAKGWDRFHVIGAVTGRIPLDSGRGNPTLMWDLHFDYEVAPDLLPGFAPMVEFHGLHYLGNGDHIPLNVGGYDYTSLGSTGVNGKTVITTGLGFRWKLTPNMSIGSTYEFPLTAKSNDITDHRVTADFKLSW